MVGIVVTIMVGRPGSSDDAGDEGAPPATRSSAAPRSTGANPPAGQQSEPAQGAEPPQPVYEHKKIEADTTNSGSYIDFDTPGEPLVVANGAPKGGDVIIGSSTGGPPDLFVPGSAARLAQWPGSGADPTADECAESVERNGTYVLTSQRGGAYCLQTDQGATVYLKVVTAPPAGVAQLEVTRW
ncbi:hypothetical protein ABZZ79_00170 [Streptomyces sp. NPDC006458]|uniref:hypothetical protein n=1 Tax=Streptomyces sp. NPDC006458 TaxID=3154302 RepID=UPI0033B5D5CE